MKPTLFCRITATVLVFLAASCSGAIESTPSQRAATPTTGIGAISVGAYDQTDRYSLTITSPPAPPATTEPAPPATTEPAPAPVSAPAPAELSPFVGGFIERTTSSRVTTRMSASALRTLLPAAGGKFAFPAPYRTEAIRLTDANSCGGGGDCVRYVGYSYWRNMNNHVGQDTMLILLGLSTASGGSGLNLFRYHKASDALERVGPVFAGTQIAVDQTGENIYFSGTQPNTVYLAQGSMLLRFDVVRKTSEVVFDAAPRFGSDVYVWQHHTSDDDRVHSATLRASSGSNMGCLIQREDTGELRLFEAEGDFDECQVDRSGRWLVIKDNIDGTNGEDNRIINLDTLAERDLLDEQGAGGHSDLGHQIFVAEDNWNNLAGAVRAWRLDQSTLTGTVVYHEPQWRSDGYSHVSYTNARPGLSAREETVCQSTVARGNYVRGSEIFCYRLDGSLDVMVVAPVMTNLDAAGGGDDYAKAPKGNLDVTGRYFLWTSNAASDRLDAFLVKVPSLLD